MKKTLINDILQETRICGSARNFEAGGFALIVVDGTNMTAIELLGAEREDQPDCSPGSVHLQIHGFIGVDRSDPHLEVAALLTILSRLWSRAVTSFRPTLFTNSIERLGLKFRVLETARAFSPQLAASVPGQLANDELYANIICDNFHLHSELMKVIDRSGCRLNAGSAVSIVRAVCNFIDISRASLDESMEKFLSLSSVCGQITPGQPGNFILVRQEFHN